MQDSPPHSITEIRRLVSDSLDGLLSPEDTAMLDTLLARFPIYQSELLAAQTLRGQIRETLENPGTPESRPVLPKPDALWREIAAQLDADAAQDTLTADPEFISAYYDGEVPRFGLGEADLEGADPDVPERAAFEAQLFRNDEASRLLGVMAQVSEAVRRFAYRQENACTVDVTQQVMAALQLPLERGGEGDLKLSGLPGSLTLEQVEMLSAYADQALTPRETIAVNRLVESEADAKTLLNGFNRLSDSIRAAADQWRLKAPDCLPALRPSLKQALLESPAAPIPLSARRKKALRILVPVAAAALLLVLSFPMLPVSPDARPGAMNGSLVALLPAGSRPESASLRENADARSTFSLPQGAADSPAIPLEPLLEPVSQARSLPVERNIITDATEHRAPSSEEYLFNALSEQNNREDISGMLRE
jgi:hypothetical protein